MALRTNKLLTNKLLTNNRLTTAKSSFTSKLIHLKKRSLHKVDYELFRNKLKQTAVKRVKNQPTKTLMYDLNNNIQAVLYKAAINDAG
ncbi:MAG: hypothetical protein OXE99_14885, partial [Cellvibrionales bacterium]|nr:hypothetical protein [Cellvibrionales bacterium]